MSCVITNLIHEIQYQYLLDRYDKPESTNAGELDRRVSSSRLEINIAGPDTPMHNALNPSIIL